MTANKTILLVDDDKTFLMALSEGLRLLNENLTVLTAEDGEQAIEILDSSNVDLLLTDLKMPKKNGFDLLKYRDSYASHMPVMVMTGYYCEEVIKDLNSLGVHCTEKPMEFDKLSKQVFSILDKENRICL